MPRQTLLAEAVLTSVAFGLAAALLLVATHCLSRHSSSQFMLTVPALATSG